MKQIFLISQCQYTHLRLSELMESAGKHAVQVISVETPEQIVSHIQSDNHLPGKQRVIVVDLTCHESSVMVKALWFLWNLSVLYSERHELRGTLCILFGHQGGLNNIRNPFTWVSPSQNFRQLKSIFLHILVVLSRYISSGYGFKRLSVNERRVINALLGGETVSDIAWIMNRTFL